MFILALNLLTLPKAFQNTLVHKQYRLNYIKTHQKWLYTKVYLNVSIIGQWLIETSSPTKHRYCKITAYILHVVTIMYRYKH